MIHKTATYRWMLMVIVLSAFANGCGDAHKADGANVPPAAVVVSHVTVMLLVVRLTPPGSWLNM